MKILFKMKEEILKRTDLPDGLRWFINQNDLSPQLLELIHRKDYSLALTAILGWLNKRLDQHIENINDVFGKEVEPFQSDDKAIEIPF